MHSNFLSGFLVVSLCCSLAFCDVVSLDASKDNAIYADNTNNSNGAGDFFFAGRNGGNSSRRGLISFDLSSIPSNAVIDSVTLNLVVSQASSGVAADIGLHRLISDWGESTSDAPGGEGGGTSAASGDATWDFAFFDNTAWTTPGGDFLGNASATTVVDVNGSYSWSSPGLIADVESWLANPTSNFGWIIIGDETAASTSKRFNSRSNGSNNPGLVIEFSVVPEPGAAVVLLALLPLGGARRRS